MTTQDLEVLFNNSIPNIGWHVSGCYLWRNDIELSPYHCSLIAERFSWPPAQPQGGRVINAKEPMQNVAASRKPRLTCLRHERIQGCLARSLLFPLLFGCILLGCTSTKPPQTPAIEFSKITPAAQGGRERVDTISGRVTGAHPGQQIVIYAHSGPWWVQPWPDKPFIPIQADSTWSTETHLGFEDAAMLVESTYHPPPTMDIAPTSGGSIVTVKIEKGIGTPELAAVKTIHFSGYDWKVRTIAGDRGGMNNLYDGSNAWTDANGALHLRIQKKEGKWSCAEVVMTRSSRAAAIMIWWPGVSRKRILRDWGTEPTMW
jgi:hypothetical protein